MVGSRIVKRLSRNEFESSEAYGDVQIDKNSEILIWKSFACTHQFCI